MNGNLLARAKPQAACGGLALALLVALGSVAAAQPASQVPPVPDVAFDQRLDEQVPLDLPFRDEAGRDVRLGDYFTGKPVILVLAYYRCPRLCTLVLNGLMEGLQELAFKAGDEFQVVAVSFDARETPEVAAAKKAAYLERYGRPGSEAGWHFLTGEQPAIDRLTEAVGFRYHYDAQQDQFAHASGVVVLTPGGKVSRYFYGIRYEPRDLRLALVEASQNKIGSVVDQLLLLCYHYDPARGRYAATVVNLVRLGGVLTVLALGGFLVLAWRYERRRAAKALELAG
jgi:protein SCO1